MHASRPRVLRTSDRGGRRLLTLLATLAIVLATGPLPPATAAAPSNDDFASSTALGSPPSSVSQSTEDATMEVSEPDPACAPTSATVWFHYTAAATGTITVDTEGSDFDTVIGAWTGSALGSLTAVGCDDDGGTGVLSSLEVAVVAGTTYRFQVGGYGGGPPRFGSLTFNLTGEAAPPTGPANDDFANAAIISALPQANSQSTLNATLEDDEPGPSYTQATVWFRYTAVSTRLLIADTDGSDFETRIGVWTGTNFGDLTEVDVHTTYVGPDYDQARVDFTGQSGVTYWFQVGGYYGDTGWLIFSLTAPGAISGTVTDDATHNPIAGLSVKAYLDDVLQKSTYTDASGAYTLDGLAAEDYSVMFSGTGYLYLPEWWDDEESSGSADPVSVNWAATTTGIDAALTRNDDPAAGPHWELRDCDSDALTSHFDPTTDCFGLLTYLPFFSPVAEHPYAGMIITAPGGGNASFPCPVSAPCSPRQTLYDPDTGQPSAYRWYWHIDGEGRVEGTYTLEMCGGMTSSSCDDILLTTTFTVGDAGPTGTVTRYAGTNRYSTAAAISFGDFPNPASVSTVFVATGLNYPDALAGAAVAGKLGAPLLLVAPDSIPDPTATELARLSPDAIVILGGTSAVSVVVETALGAYAPTVTRIAGSNRYATAVQISQYGYPGTAATVIVATGGGFADALAGGPAAVALGGPVLLTDANTLPGVVAAEIARLSPARIVVVGGSSAVSDSVFNALTAIQANTVRLSGSNRYNTSVEISKDAFAGGSSRVYVATGLNFPDALAGAAAAGWYSAPVLLVPDTGVPPSVSAEITRLGASTIIVLGGTGVVSVQIEATLAGLL